MNILTGNIFSDVELPKLIRLQFRGRYCLGLQRPDGKLSNLVFWSPEQALIASGLVEDLWKEVETEVFTLLVESEAPGGYKLFARQSRRGSVSAVIAWGPEGILPDIATSAHRAVQACVESLRRDGAPYACHSNAPSSHR